MKYFLTISTISILTISLINAIAIDDYHCKVPTCRDFHYGLAKYPRHKHYVDVCYDTVYALQSIPTKHGKCIDDKTGKVHAPCIYGLNDLPAKDAKYYCGYTLMKYCAVHIGLDQIPLNSDY